MCNCAPALVLCAKPHNSTRLPVPEYIGVGEGYIAKTIKERKERKKDQEQVREKSFLEMKKDVGMTTAQKSKETRRVEMGSIFVLYIQPTIPTYTLGSFRL